MECKFLHLICHSGDLCWCPLNKQSRLGDLGKHLVGNNVKELLIAGHPNPVTDVRKCLLWFPDQVTTMHLNNFISQVEQGKDLLGCLSSSKVCVNASV